MEPLGVQRRYVPPFKGLVSAKVDLEAQGRDSTFSFSYTLLKKAILHHTRAFVKYILATSVCGYLELKRKWTGHHHGSCHTHFIEKVTVSVKWAWLH